MLWDLKVVESRLRPGKREAGKDASTLATPLSRVRGPPRSDRMEASMAGLWFLGLSLGTLATDRCSHRATYQAPEEPL